ncbi:TIGR01777 family oxidoreductase [Hymenobacter sp. HSC-4F20]|uniref:TIGR01777 family oxidoreductase n=1 Tax=Hymenobacter sp. HSC-4F20 TaxID=2864135 RepID=UPI001C73238F|nr:TIGR01777 family oxidoreductase [Hymenobacter sp. HSC-4F20]MBX0290918.1 TIGR01777 family oxidoreductase [Hymenobacter sp. HSC-4F20]
MNQPLIVLAGGTGFLGRQVACYFRQLGYEVLTLTRRVRRFGEVAWDGRTLGAWAAKLEGAAVVLNLAGKSVDCRYNAVNKYAIIRSRTESTRVLGEAIARCQRPPTVWLNASTATIYQHTEGAEPANTEEAGCLGRGFSEMVAQRWEAEFWLAQVPRTRQVALRTAIVLGSDGGALPVLTRLAKRGLCTPQGDGQQWVSWLHVEDFCRAVEFLVRNPTLAGTFNLCAPQPLHNYAFNGLLAQHYQPRWQLPQPRWLLEIGAFLLRTETELILKSRKVVPQRLLEAGFRFRYPSCELALADLLPQLG